MRKFISLSYSLLVWIALLAVGVWVFASLSTSEPLPSETVDDAAGWAYAFGLIFIGLSIFALLAFIGKLIAFARKSCFGRWFWGLLPFLFDIYSVGALVSIAATEFSLFSIISLLLVLLGIVSIISTPIVLSRGQG